MTTRSKVTWCAGLVLACAVGLSLFGPTRSSFDAPRVADGVEQRPETGPAPLPSARVADERGSNAELDSRWQLGARRAYEGDYSSWLDQSAVGSNLFAITASGALSITVVQDDGKERLLEVSIASLAISFTDEATDLVTTQELRRDAGRPFYVKLTHSGVVPGLFLPRGLNPHSDRLMRTLAGVLQFVPTSQADRVRWSVEELGVDGRYLAHYQRRGEAVEKRKDKAVLSDAAPEGTQIDSVGTYAVDASGVIERVAFTEDVVIPFGMKKIKGHQDISLALQNERLTKVAPPNLTDYEFTPLDSTQLGKGLALDEPSDAELAAGQTFTGLSQEMAKLADADRERYVATRERLVALLRTDPGAIAQCVEALRGQLSVHERAALMGALSDAATPAAQNALIELANDPNVPADMRQGAMINVALTDAPTEDTVTALASLAKGGDPALRAQATLALGAASGTAQHGIDSSAARAAEQAIAELGANFKNATSTQEKLTYAGALGNVGGEAALEASQAAIADGDEALRAQGATSLRLVEDSKADSMLAELLVDDPSPLVRSRAAAATHFRGPNGEVLAALDVAARTDDDVSVRQSALSAVSAHVSTSDEARATVQWIAENEPDEGLRRLASDALIDPSETAEQPEPEADTTSEPTDEAREE